MAYLIDSQGGKLNKFEPIRIDYFNREKHWSDFKDLVQRPVSQVLEISDAALVSLYERTAGNPYFTKLICHALFALLVSRRDCHVTPKEVQEATRQALQTVTSTSFQHFWEDGIVDTDERFEERTMIRRKILVALAEVIKQNPVAQKSLLIEESVKQGVSEREVEDELRDFVRRQILILQEGAYQCKVPLFRMWLQEKGLREIITTFPDTKVMENYRKEEEEAYVQPDEIVNLIKNKGFYYKAKNLSEDKLRAWLKQFGSNSEQRLMFSILESLTFYNNSNIRALLNEAHEMVRADSIHYIRQRERKRDDILVSYLDSPGKSGASYASLYVEQASISKNNIVERSRLRSTLTTKMKKEDPPHSLVFIDDFIGTGESAKKYFKYLDEICGDVLRDSKLRIFFIAMVGFEQGKQVVEQALAALKLNVNVRICRLLGESDRCFSDTSSFFDNTLQKESARNIAYKYGIKLVPGQPLGYGDCQATIVFEDSCPNNTLPIFWSDSENWIPLFRRD